MRFLDFAEGAWALSLIEGYNPGHQAVQIGINGKGEVFVQPWMYSPQAGKQFPWSNRCPTRHQETGAVE